MVERNINRRRLLGAAAAAGAASLGAPEIVAAAVSRAAPAKIPLTTARSSTRHIARFAKRVDLIRQSLDVPGMSLAVLHQQTVVLARGFGVIDMARRTKATENTPYAIASVTKTFATAVIMKLVEQGKLDLDAPMSAYDRDYLQWCASLRKANVASARDYNCDTERITLRHHLSHTAQGTPGTNFEYNAMLFGRLTAVIDAVSPGGYLAALEEDILAPLGMRDTALGTKDARKSAVIARMAKPYRLDANDNLVESGGGGRSFDRVTASSGIISTVMDLAKYDVGIDRDVVYGAQAKQQIWTPAVSRTGQTLPYGLGWFVQGDYGSKGQLVWHYGQYPTAFSSLLFKVPDRQLTLIFLACTDRASSVFSLGNGDPLRSAFVSAFLDEFAGFA